MTDWNPETYGRFRGLRLRPALDLLAQIGELPYGHIVDLGCGSGAVGPALRARWPLRRITGVDASPAMLSEAEAAGCYDGLDAADAAEWVPDAACALIFSNAALHWVPDHSALMPRLARMLAPGGTLAVQMPRQFGAPSHRFLRDFAAEMFPDRFDVTFVPPVASAIDYHQMLAPIGEITVWETEYLQRLAPVTPGHPVRAFTESTAMRPFVERMSSDEAASFTARYDAALEAAYPAEADGGVLFPFRRLFFTLTV